MRWSPGWPASRSSFTIAQRRIIVWFSETRTQLFSHFQPLEAAWDVLSWVARTTFGGLAVPLMWLAVAGIVYGVGVTTDWRSVARQVGGDRADDILDRSADTQRVIRGRWSRLPVYVREKGSEHASAQLGRFKPITDAARVILHAGIPALAMYAVAYIALAWLDRSGSYYGADLGDGYLLRGMAWLLGPHPMPFWSAYLEPLSLISHVIVEPLRICLIASTFAYCVANAQRATPPVTASTAP